tara:strand:+ start:1253 stop:1432 length:180 start_codon:yes stop_codon:yes gene_type:complete
MENWIHTMGFIFSGLVIVRNVFLLATSLFSANPTKYTLNYPELIILGISVSYFLTYLIR